MCESWTLMKEEKFGIVTMEMWRQNVECKLWCEMD